MVLHQRAICFLVCGGWCSSKKQVITFGCFHWLFGWLPMCNVVSPSTIIVSTARCKSNSNISSGQLIFGERFENQAAAAQFPLYDAAHLENRCADEEATSMLFWGYTFTGRDDVVLTLIMSDFIDAQGNIEFSERKGNWIPNVLGARLFLRCCDTCLAGMKIPPPSPLRWDALVPF